MWVLYSIIAAVCLSIGQISRKKALMLEHTLEFSSFRSYINLVLLFLLSIFIPLSLPTNEIFLIFIIAGISSFGLLIATNAIKHAQLSEISPLEGLNSVFLLILGFMFLNELPKKINLIGLVIIIFGIFFLRFESKSIIDPFKKLLRTGSRRFLFSAFLFSLGSVAIRPILEKFNPLTVLFYTWLFISIQIILLEFLFFGLRDAGDFKRKKWSILIAGVTFFFAKLFTYLALSYPDAQVVLVRTLTTSGIVFSTIFGAIMFKEGSLKQKILGVLIILIGGLLVTL